VGAAAFTSVLAPAEYVSKFLLNSLASFFAAELRQQRDRID